MTIESGVRNARTQPGVELSRLPPNPNRVPGQEWSDRSNESRLASGSASMASGA